MANPVVSYVNGLVEKKFAELAGTINTDKHSTRAAAFELADECGFHMVGQGMPYETIAEAVDDAPEESGGPDHPYGESGYEPGATVLVTDQYDAEASGESWPVKIHEKQIDVHGYARGGARIVGDRKNPIFSVRGVGSTDYRNCRSFSNFRTYRGAPVFKIDSDNGLLVSDIVARGSSGVVNVWGGPEDYLDSVVMRFNNVHAFWPKEDAFVFDRACAGNATHLDNIWVHGGEGVGVRSRGAAVSISRSTIEGRSDRAIVAKEAVALSLWGNYFEANAKARPGGAYPYDVQLNDVYGALIMGNYFNGAGGVMRAINCYDVECPTIMANVFNNYSNSERDGDTGHSLGLHGNCRYPTVFGNVGLADQGGSMRTELVGLKYGSGAQELHEFNNLSYESESGNEDPDSPGSPDSTDAPSN